MAGSRSSIGTLARLATLTLILFSALGTDELRGGAPAYTLTDLGTFGSIQSAQALDVNDLGQVAGIALQPRIPLAKRLEDRPRNTGKRLVRLGPRAQ